MLSQTGLGTMLAMLRARSCLGLVHVRWFHAHRHRPRRLRSELQACHSTARIAGLSDFTSHGQGRSDWSYRRDSDE